MRGKVQGDWPLVGRSAELHQVRGLITAGAAAVVIAGPAGVGKTRLAAEALKLADAAGLCTARVTATRAAATLPLGALAGLLPAGHHGESGGVDDRADLLRRSAAALVERAGNRRLVLFVDDAHLLDDASATLIQQLAVMQRAFVLMTVRIGEPAPEPVTGLWKDGLAERIELVGLDARGVEAVLEATLDGPVDRGSVAQIAVRCEGNVLFLRELVTGALLDGSLCDDGGIWRLTGPLRPSERLVELVEARLGALEPDERCLLELVSFGEPLGPAELQRLADPSLAEGLERKGLLVSRIDGHRVEVRLAHPLYGDVLRARMPAMRLPEIARSLAEAVEATGGRRREDTLRVGTWRLEGGGAQPELMLAAATTARWRYDFPLAERLAAAAVDAGAGFEAELLAAQLVGLQGRAEEAHLRLVALAERAQTDADRGRVAVSNLDYLALYMGRMEEGLRMAVEAEAAIADPVWRAEIMARRAVTLLALKGPRSAADLAELPLREATGRGLVWACMIGSFSSGRIGRIQAALETADRGYGAHVALSQPLDWYPWIHLYTRCEALVHAGRFHDAEVLADAQYHHGVAEGSGEAQAFFSWHLATVVGERGHVQRSAHHAREGAALFRQLGRPHYVREVMIGLVLALALSGEAAEAAEALAALDALDLPPTLFKPIELIEARAWTAVAGGDLGLGHRLLEEAALQAERTGDRVGEAASLHGLARLGRARETVARLEVLAGEIEGDLASARAAHARAIVAEEPQGLEEASAVFDAIGADLLAAEAAADAAVAWRRAGQPRPAAAAENRAAALADRCEGAVTPALQVVERRGHLTPAERQVALLAAGGRSNKEIAETVFIAVRTVENHLQRVYEKLGIGGRRELADALELGGSAPRR
jgi:DNA-binding CsgD family transcriptional regulator